MKKILSFILAAITAFSVVTVAFAGEDGVTENAAETITSFTLVEQPGTLGAVNGWYSAPDDTYYFFILKSDDLHNVKIFFDSTGDVYVGNTKLVSGGTTDVFDCDDFLHCDEHKNLKLTCDGHIYDVKVIAIGDTPSIYINTQSGSLKNVHADKEYKEPGTTLIVKPDGSVVYDGTLEYIKGRGNSTWQMDKKPYNIKLDSKTNLFSMGKSKKWCLIANATDPTLMRNCAAFAAGRELGLEYSPKYQATNLYINGDYMGSYLLTTKVEIASNSVDIADLEGDTEDVNDAELDTYKKLGTYGRFSGLLEGTKMWYDIPNNPENITGGYLLEMEIADRYYAEASGFVTTRSQPIILKGPEYATKAQIDYISDYYQQFEDAVFSDTGCNSLGKHYSEYCDLDSLAKVYLINEWSMNMDASVTSSYFYKDVDDKMYCGPVWDYDIAFGNNTNTRFGINFNDPQQWAVCIGRQYKNTVFGSSDIMEKPTLFNQLCKHEDFMRRVRQIWDETAREAFRKLADINSGSVIVYATAHGENAIANDIRWNVYATTDIDLISSRYTDLCYQLAVFGNKRIAFLETNLGHIIENPQGATGFKAACKKALVGINSIFEKFIVTFGLENKI